MERVYVWIQLKLVSMEHVDVLLDITHPKLIILVGKHV
jgi:hypothetical protein